MIADGSGSFGGLRIAEFFAQASSVAPVPGGGSVSAVCGYLAVSLLLKAIRISARAHSEDASLSDIDNQLAAAANRLLTCAQLDSDSFEAYMRALKLPKSAPEEVTRRQNAIHQAAVDATVSALNILDVGNRILEIAHHVQGRLSASILADERSAVEIISAMNSTAEWNADANMVSLKGEVALGTRLQDAKNKHSTLLAACHAS